MKLTEKEEVILLKNAVTELLDQVEHNLYIVQKERTLARIKYLETALAIRYRFDNGPSEVV